MIGLFMLNLISLTDGPEMNIKTNPTKTYKVLICDLVGLKLGANGEPDPIEVRNYIEAAGGVFHTSGLDTAVQLSKGRINFFYLPDISTEEELLHETRDARYDGVIAAATLIPEKCIFGIAGVRIGAGTSNMQSASWGGGDGIGGNAVLMNTPGLNSVATAQMVMRGLLKFAPDLPFEHLHDLVMAGDFDTGRDLRRFPTEKLEGKRLSVLGYGNIGREVAKLGKAFGMLVTIYARSHRREQIEAEGFRFSGNPVQAATDADVVSVHIGLGQFNADDKQYANYGFIGSDILSAMSDESILINFDRGEVVDVQALDTAMANNKVFAAAIDADIFRTEDGILSGPLTPYIPLAHRYPGRILLLPHAAADTDHPSRVAGAKQAVDQMIAAIHSGEISNLKGDLPNDFYINTVKL